MIERRWCSQCGEVSTRTCGHPGTRQVGYASTVTVVVLDRRLELDVGRFGYRGNPTSTLAPADQERAVRARIEEMRRQTREKSRSRHVGRKREDDIVVEGAIPTALLFGLKRQYGNSILRNPTELLRSQGLLFRDN